MCMVDDCNRLVETDALSVAGCRMSQVSAIAVFKRIGRYFSRYLRRYIF